VDEFAYLSVLISIILGLGMTHLLTGVGRIIEARDRVRMYWPPLAWAALLLIIHVQTWWAFFGLRNHHGWNFFGFLVVLLQPILLYLLAALALPQFTDGSSVDLRSSYYANTRWFFGLAMTLILGSFVRDLVINGALPRRFNVAVQLVFFVLAAGAAATRRPWYHEVVAALYLILLSAYIAVLFARLS
jgi:hypothetical protein